MKLKQISKDFIIIGCFIIFGGALTYAANNYESPLGKDISKSLVLIQNYRP